MGKTASRIVMAALVAAAVAGCLGSLACSPREPAGTTPATSTPAAATPAAAATEPVPALSPAPNARWTVVVCSSRSSPVTLEAGPSKDDHGVFATWQQGGQRIYALPQRVQNLTEVYVRAVKPADGMPVELCVLFDGHPKQRLAFDEREEDKTVKSSDSDEDDCRCVQ